MSDEGGYKDKVGDFVDILFKEMFNCGYNDEFNNYFIAKDRGYKNFKEFKETYMLYTSVNNYNVDTVISKIADIKLNKQLKCNPANNINRSNYCKSLFIKALEQTYDENNNPDIMFKFLSDFCESDMDIKINENDYIQVIKHFLKKSDKINDNVRQNIRSLTRYMIKNTKIRNFSFIKDIIVNRKISDANEQALIQDIVLTAIDNNLTFLTGDEISNSQQLVEKLFNCNFSSSNTTQQDTSIFTIVKNLILSGNVKEKEDFSEYSGFLMPNETAKLKQILAKTVAVTKIIKEGEQDCSKLKDAVVKFVNGDTGLTIEDITKIKVNHKSISKFCEDKVASGNKKCAYYSWFLNKLVINGCIVKNLTASTTTEENETQQPLILTAIQEQQVISDTYKEFENYKTDSIKRADKGENYYQTFRNSFMNTQEQNKTYQKRSIINYYDTTEGKSGIYDENESDRYCPDYYTIEGKSGIYDENESDRYSPDYYTIEGKSGIYDENESDRYSPDYYTTTIDGVIIDIINNSVREINNKLNTVYLQQQATLNQEKSDKFKRFCTVFDLIRANTLLFNVIKGNAIKGIDASTIS